MLTLWGIPACLRDHTVVTDMVTEHTATGWIGGEVSVKAHMHQGEEPPCGSELTDG